MRASSCHRRGPGEPRWRLDEALACHDIWAEVLVPEPAILSAPEEGPVAGAVEFHLIDLHGNLVRLGGYQA